MRFPDVTCFILCAAAACSPLELYRGVQSSVWTPDYLKALCRKDAGYHAYRTVYGSPGLYSPGTNYDPKPGCTSAYCPSALFDGFDFVEVEHDGGPDGVVNKLGPGTYRISLKSLGYPDCRRRVEPTWFRKTGRPERPVPALCLAYEQISKITARYEAGGPDEVTTPELAAHDVRRLIMEIKDRQSNQVIGRAIQYMYMGDETSAGVPETHKCPESLDSSLLLRTVFLNTKR